MAKKYGKKVKELMAKEIKDLLPGNSGFLISSVEKIKASQINELRKSMRKSGSRYLVIKNRVMKRVLKEAGVSGLDEVVSRKSILGISVVKDDPVLVAKLLMEFSKKNQGFKVVEGYIDGKVLSVENVKQLSELPGREQLIAMAVGMIASPIRSFVGVLGGILRSPLYALNSIKEKKEAGQ